MTEQRVLLLISDTGGGHRASAAAIVEGLTELHGDAVRCDIVDLLVEHGPWPLNRIPRLYLPLTSRYLGLWQLLWRMGEHPTIWHTTSAAVLAWNSNRLRRFYYAHPADLVVAIHPLLNLVPRLALRRWVPGIPFATVVTDLTTAHATWYDPGVDLLCASCAEVGQAAVAAGLPARRVRVLGLPIRSAFWQPPPPQAVLRQQLHLLDRPTVLVMSGGEGMGPVTAVVDALAATLKPLPGQIVVICGRNDRLQRELSQRSWPLPVRVLGFVEDVYAWMGACDCVISKAGPGTIAEAMACQLPILLSSFIPGQEDGNVAYVVQHGLGTYSPHPVELATIARRWLQPGSPELGDMRQNARKLARPRAAIDIARALSELL